MPDDVNELQQAVDAAPGDDQLRLRLARALLAAGQPEPALAHARLLLAALPAWIDALQVAHRAAAALGEAEAALGYRRLLTAIGAPPDTPAPPPDPLAAGPSRPLAAEEAPREAAPVGDLDGPPAPAAPGTYDADVEGPTVSWADVAGMDSVKESIEGRFLAPARNPELARAFGTTGRGGLLLYGPPGCGKTFLARALAGELGASFLPIGINQVLDMWVGSSERNLHDLFETARRLRPCLIFFDELDALGQRRSNLRNAPTMRATVNQLLAELDGVDADNRSVFVLGATNQPWEIDGALRRPGRFDRLAFVPPPDEAARVAILRSNLRQRAIAETIDLAGVAGQTAGWSGADLTALCEAAATAAMQASVRAGRILPIGTGELLAATQLIRPSVASWFELAQPAANFANHDGEYDELLAYLRRRRR